MTEDVALPANKALNSVVSRLCIRALVVVALAVSNALSAVNELMLEKLLESESTGDATDTSVGKALAAESDAVVAVVVLVSGVLSDEELLPPPQPTKLNAIPADKAKRLFLKLKLIALFMIGSFINFDT